MKIAETVTFGGSGLERHAELRGTQDASPAQGDLAVLVWRGKIFMDIDPTKGLALIDACHSICSTASHLFLGRDNGIGLHAFDISSWEPEDQDLPDGTSFFDPSLQVHPKLPQTQAFCELRSRMNELTPREAELAATAKALFHWHRSHKFCPKCGGRTEIRQSGWQLSCSSCQAPQFPRTDPVVIMLITHGDSVLMGRSHGWPDKMYSLLAGFIEPGETIEAAVRREVYEEASIRVGQVSYLASQPWAFPYSLMFGCHGEAETTDINVDPEELDDAFWITKSELHEVFSGNSDRIMPARKGSIAHFLVKNWLADRLE